MDLFTREDLKGLLAEREGPCVSLFMPTDRKGAEADRIRWRRLLAEAEKRLDEAGWDHEAKGWLAPARGLGEDSRFFQQGDGLAVFLAPDFLRVHHLPQAPAELVVVGSRFHVKPMLPLLSGDGRFFVLALSQNGVRLLEGTRDSVTEVTLRGVPSNFEDAMKTHDRDEVLTFHTRPTSGGTWGAIFQGHGVGIDDKKDDLLRYFQAVDRGLHAYLRDEKATLVLAAVEYLHPIYHQANTYPHLLKEGIKGAPDRLSDRDLHDRAWALVSPSFEEARRKAAGQYSQLAGTGRTSCDLKSVVAAAFEGRVETLFVSRDRQVWGVFNAPAGQVEQHPTPVFGDVDLLDLAAAQTLLHGQTVYAVEPALVPGGADVAAVYHLPLPKRGR